MAAEALVGTPPHRAATILDPALITLQVVGAATHLAASSEARSALKRAMGDARMRWKRASCSSSTSFSPAASEQ